MPRQERSAGFILFRTDASAPGGRVFLLLDYGRHWDYAKGHVEKDETDLAAAIRELHEETGIPPPRVVDGFEEKIEYYFRSSKYGLIKKCVIFYLAETEATEVKLSHEHVGFEFLDFEKAQKRLSYSTARGVLRKANAFLKSTP